MQQEIEIRVKNRKKYFKEVKAVDDISFEVQKGELFGFLGVNGAGKSTTIRMMCTLFSPTDGEIWIGGQQAGVQDEQIRQKIGVVWQENVLDDRLSVKENLQVRAAMYKTTRAWQKERIQTVCEKLHLEDIYARRYAKLSGGQKRRCEIAAALLNDPEVLFLDEPTTGLDPATRKQVWSSVESLQRDDQVTVFLTTHYMEEAASAGHIAIIDKGKICEFGTPQELKMRYAKDTLKLYYKEKAPQIKTFDNSMEALPVLNRLADELEGFELQQGTIRVGLHYLLINAIVLGGGSFFGWFDIHELWQVGMMALLIAIIFVIISYYSWRKANREAENLNERLKGRNGSNGNNGNNESNGSDNNV